MMQSTYFFSFYSVFIIFLTFVKASLSFRVLKIQKYVFLMGFIQL